MWRNDTIQETLFSRGIKLCDFISYWIIESFPRWIALMTRIHARGKTKMRYQLRVPFVF